MRKIRVTITVDREILERFREKCRKNDIKVSTKINTLMKEWIKNKGGEDEGNHT